jgi:hypothetical protein
MPWNVKNEMPTGRMISMNGSSWPPPSACSRWLADPTRKSRYLKVDSSSRCPPTVTPTIHCRVRCTDARPIAIPPPYVSSELPASSRQ